MNLKEFKETLNQIPSTYDNIEISFIYNHKEYLINDIEWYENDIHNNKKYIDITLKA